MMPRGLEVLPTPGAFESGFGVSWAPLLLAHLCTSLSPSSSGVPGEDTQGPRLGWGLALLLPISHFNDPYHCGVRAPASCPHCCRGPSPL